MLSVMGLTVAPAHRHPLEQLARLEGERRDDVASDAFLALAESIQLNAEFEAITR